ncbi:nucleoside deaminase [Aspergillus affinis]|uniref:nucleoside deaminase n=1 Tax=Aspergillus affinis TaxID=1070780 RepID=UPI0022FEB009|nr:putative cytosine deaminase [Aspergillus affinis]KAI9037315.1 putative cytosine deaminase [Aspergillus affinis]
MLSSTDISYLRRCVELAREALDAGDAPFGSVLVDAKGKVLREDRNRDTTEGDVTLHPEFTLAVWAQKHMAPADRAAATVYTSGEHCPMCSTTHAYAGLGRIVYASSSAQLVQWQTELGVKAGPVNPLSINQVVPGLAVDGPAEGLDREVFELHQLKQARVAAYYTHVNYSAWRFYRPTQPETPQFRSLLYVNRRISTSSHHQIQCGHPDVVAIKIWTPELQYLVFSIYIQPIATHDAFETSSNHEILTEIQRTIQEQMEQGNRTTKLILAGPSGHILEIESPTRADQKPQTEKGVWPSRLDRTFLAHVRENADYIPAVCIEEDQTRGILNVIFAVNKARVSDGNDVLLHAQQVFDEIFTLLAQVSTGDTLRVKNQIFYVAVSMCSSRILSRLRLAPSGR